MKTLIDANVILRYLLCDDEEKSETAKVAIEDGTFTLPEVIAEVVYVLKGVYKIERKIIRDVLIDFLDEVDIDNKDIIKKALHLFDETSLDFVDCILISYHSLLGVKVLSFDKKINKRL